jgi:2-polyprenyl-3-methyl-5-hydroxy-6-metoxy-1,4-benzoquinol methylase
MEPAQIDRTPFADLDGTTPELLALLLAALESMGNHPALRPEPGQRLLDAGCGGGDVARSLAAEVGPSGAVVAVDLSAATLAAARSRHDGSPVTYRTGDVAALELGDDEVDGVWCERVLQHVADPGAAIAELVRVTRPGGRVCLVDTDWLSLAFDGVPAHLAAAVSAELHDRFDLEQRGIGRNLRRRLVAAGLAEVTAVPVTCFFDTPESAAVVLPMVNPAVPAESWSGSSEVREDWFAAVDEAGRRGDFLAVLTIWVAAGTV